MEADPTECNKKNSSKQVYNRDRLSAKTFSEPFLWWILELYSCNNTAQRTRCWLWLNMRARNMSGLWSVYRTTGDMLHPNNKARVPFCGVVYLIFIKLAGIITNGRSKPCKSCNSTAPTPTAPASTSCLKGRVNPSTYHLKGSFNKSLIILAFHFFLGNSKVLLSQSFGLTQMLKEVFHIPPYFCFGTPLLNQKCLIQSFEGSAWSLIPTSLSF